jgi:hypothetical protein
MGFIGLPARLLLVEVDFPVPPDCPSSALILGPFRVLGHHFAHELGVIGFVQRHLACSQRRNPFALTEEICPADYTLPQLSAA